MRNKVGMAFKVLGYIAALPLVILPLVSMTGKWASTGFQELNWSWSLLGPGLITFTVLYGIGYWLSDEKKSDRPRGDEGSTLSGRREKK